MKILVVDDHVLIRDALRGVLGELNNDAVFLEASDACEAMEHLTRAPDIELILLDLNLPDGDGFELLHTVRERHPAIPVVILSVSNDRDDIARSLQLGALGFIPKSARREVMLGAFRLIFEGGVYVPPEIFTGPRAARAIRSHTIRPPAAAELGLTERQMEVLALMMQGKSNKTICRALDIAVPTVKNHITAILRALDASNRTEAVIAAVALGLGTGREQR